MRPLRQGKYGDSLSGECMFDRYSLAWFLNTNPLGKGWYKLGTVELSYTPILRDLGD